MKAASSLTIGMRSLHPLGFLLRAMYSEALAEPPLKEEGQRAGDAHRPTAFLAVLYLGTLGPKCPLSHDERKVAKEGYLA